MKKLATLAVLAALSAACAKGAPPRPTLTTEDDKTVYAIGVALARSIQPLQLSPTELELVVAGLREGSAGKAELTVESRQVQIQQFAQGRRSRMGQAESKKGTEYLAKAAKEPGAVTSASGLVYIPIKEGTGAPPKASDTVKVNYTGRLVDGTVFDASERHGGPATFPLSGVIPCWTEGVQKLKVGGRARLVCPAAIAYGDHGAGSEIPPGATLDFEVELVGIVSK